MDTRNWSGGINRRKGGLAGQHIDVDDDGFLFSSWRQIVELRLVMCFLSISEMIDEWVLHIDGTITD
jgi:hypothetical protein